MVELIRIRNLSFSYGKKTVLSEVNLSIGGGEFVGVIGPVGSGKSTLLLTMNGVIPQLIGGNFEGEITVCGMDTRKNKVSKISDKVGIVLQDPNSQIFSLKVSDEVAFALENRGIPRDEINRRVLRYLSLFGLGQMRDDDPNDLSEGQKQKLAIASTLAMEPEVILLDEPASSLDFGSAKELYAMLARMSKQGRTVVVVEHDTEMLVEYASRILLLRDCRIELDGSPKEVLSDPRIEEYGLRIPCSLRRKGKPRRVLR